MFPEVYKTVKLVANADVQRRHACNRSWRGVEYRGVYIFIESIIPIMNLIEV
jgi:hypothetical protein